VFALILESTPTGRSFIRSWDNAQCIGESQEWQSAETFTSEDAAMNHYRTSIRPGLKRVMAQAVREVKNGTMMHRRLE
jgi:hypothetical protein